MKMNISFGKLCGLLLSLFGLLLGMPKVFAQSGNEARQTYTIRATVSDDRTGMVKGDGTYQEGDTVTLTATPFTGYHFDRWEENGQKVEGAEATYRFVANANRTLRAVFVINTYRLSLVKQGDGIVIPPGTTFEHNSRVRLESSPSSGYSFKGYYLGSSAGTLLSDSVVYVFYIQSDMQIAVVFEIGKIEIDASVAETSVSMGTVKGAGKYEAGSPVTLTAYPNPFHRFVAWMEGRDTVSKNPVYSFVAERKRTVRALFSMEYHTVSATANIFGSGTVTGAGRYSAADNNTIVLTARPNTGYEFLYWQSDKDGAVYEDSAITVLKNGHLREDLSYTAYFAIKDFHIAVETVPEGAAVIEGAGTYEYNSSVTLRAIPYDNYNFVAWVRTDAGKPGGSADTNINNPLIFTIYQGLDRTYKALFELKRHTVRLSTQPEEGYGTVSGDGSYAHFDTAVLKAMPEEGYEFNYWGTRRGLNITKVSEENPYKVEVLQDVDLVAVFSVLRNHVKAESLPANAGTISGEGPYVAGEYATLTAEAAEGYRFSHWENGEHEVVSRSPQLNLWVQSDTTVYASFTPLRYDFILMTEGASSVGGKVGAKGKVDLGTMHTLEVYYGDTLHLEAQANTDENYAFIQWRTLYTDKDGKVKDSLYSRNQEAIYVVRGYSRIVGYFHTDAHLITASVEPEASGEVLNQGYYRDELWMELEAAPAKGYDFSHWLDEEGNPMPQTSNRLQIQSFHDTTVKAVFTQATLQVDVDIWGRNNCGSVEGEGAYKYETAVTLTATPEYGYVFSGWYDAADTLRTNCLEKSATYTFNIEEHRWLAADFVPQKFTIKVVKQEGEGNIIGIGEYDYLDEVLLIPDPAPGYEIKYMLLVREPAYDTFREYFAGVNMTQDWKLEVYFEPITYALQVFSSNVDMGSVVTEDSYKDLEAGSEIKLVAKPGQNYRFFQWRDRWGKRLSRSEDYTVTVWRDTVVYADFLPENKTLIAESENILQGEVIYTNQPYYGNTVRVEALPAEGYEFDSWVLKNKPDQVVSNSSILSVYVTQDSSLVARFRPIHRTINLRPNIQGGGDIWLEIVQDQDPENTVNEGRYAYVKQNSRAILHADPAHNYEFSSWLRRNSSARLGGINLGKEPVVSIEVDENIEIEAVFEPKLFHIQVKADANLGSVQGSGYYGYGEKVTIKATPGDYAFKGWKTADGWISYNPEYMLTVTKDTTVIAYFSYDSVRLALYADLGGSVSGDGSYLKGTTAVARATASEKYTFDAWYDLSGKRLSNKNPYTLTLNESSSMRAKFIATELNVGVVATEGGKVEGGGKTFYASSVQLEAIPDLGYRFVRWESESANLDRQRASLPVLNWYVTENVTFTAVFEPLRYYVEVEASPLLAGTVSGGGTFNYGASASLVARPDANHDFFAWTRNGEVVETNPSLNMEVMEDAAYVALFVPKRYNVDTWVEPQYGGLSYGGGSYYWGDTAKLGIYLYDSVTFKYWSNADDEQLSVLETYLYPVLSAGNFTAWVDAPESLRDPDDDPDNPHKPNLDTVFMPVFTPAGGMVDSGSTVSISCATADATIYYTINGNNPTENSARYDAPIVINEAMTIRAFAVKDSMVSSAVAVATYTIRPGSGGGDGGGDTVGPGPGPGPDPDKPGDTVKTPVFTPDGGEIERGSTVSISCATAGATIYYTVNGEDPTVENSQEYTEPIVIDEAMTIKAFAIKEERVNSAVAEATFTVKSEGGDDPNQDTLNPDRHIKVRVYPIPLGKDEELHIESDRKNIQSIRIFSVTGRQILYRRFSQDGVQSVSVYLLDVQAGCYFYEINLTGGARKKGKLITT